MLRYILNNKWFFRTIGVFIILSIAVILLYRDTNTPTIDPVPDNPSRISDISTETNEVEVTEQTPITPINTDTSITEISTTTPEVEIVEETPQALPVETEIEQEQEANMDNISPNGLGPYPEVSLDYYRKNGPTSWQINHKEYREPGLVFELMDRILVKLWNDGDRDFKGAITKNGKVYVKYPNRAYVRYTTYTRPDGSTGRYISSWESHNDLEKPSEEDLRNENISQDIELIDLDDTDVGIDPYEFLGLN